MTSHIEELAIRREAAWQKLLEAERNSARLLEEYRDIPGGVLSIEQELKLRDARFDESRWRFNFVEAYRAWREAQDNPREKRTP